MTLRQIAQTVGLSTSTVSFVLNNRLDIMIPAETRERVWAVARELGYRPNRAAQALVRGRTMTVTIRLGSDPLWLAHIPKLLAAAERRGLAMMLVGENPVLSDGEFSLEDGILRLEIDDLNWSWPLAECGGIESAVLLAWKQLDAQTAKISGNS